MVFLPERKTSRSLNQMLEQVSPHLHVRTYSDPLDVLNALAEGEAPIGALIDVDSAACNGLRLVRVMQALRYDLPLVFLSASGRYAVEAFSLGVADYLLLPTEPEKLADVVQKLRQNRAKSQSGGIYIRTFGSFEVLVDGKPIPWKNTKSKELLAFLVDARGDNVSSEKIQKTLWPDAESAQAAQSYHTTLFQLRKKLESCDISGLLIGSRGSQRVNAELFDCDLYEFEREMEAGTKESYRRAFDLYRGLYMDKNSYEWSHFTRVWVEMQFERTFPYA